MKITPYNKLIRDKIPQIIEQTGKHAHIEVLDEYEYKRFLEDKLEEELDEYLESGNIEELADLVEVVHALLKCKNISIETFEKMRKQKAEDRGVFDKRFLLKEVLEEEEA